MTGYISKSKTSHVYSELLRRLRSGEFSFGETLTLKKLTEEFQVSRQPMMAAIGLLQLEGFLMVRPQVGCRVVTPKADEVSEFFELFAVSEGLMTKLAAARQTSADIPALRAAEDRLSAVQMNGTLTMDYGKISRAFHREIHKISRAMALSNRVVSLWGLADFYLNSAHSSIRPEDEVKEREERRLIVDAISNGESDLAEATMRSHIRAKLYRLGSGCLVQLAN